MFGISKLCYLISSGFIKGEDGEVPQHIEFQPKFENGAVLIVVCIHVSIPQHIEFQPKFENGTVLIVFCINVSTPQQVEFQPKFLLWFVYLFLFPNI